MIKIISLASMLAFLLVGCTTRPSLTTATKEQIIDQETSKAISDLQNGVSIYFDTGSSEIETKYNLYLKTAAHMLEIQPNLLIGLEGHTDNVGLAGINKRISLERANAVKDKLIKEYHVNPDQIMTIGLGASNPLYDNKTAEGRANNRRVTATVYVK